ncbi:hypothetical protein [Shinella sp. JR1-6]|uniref:hypothetical protein n=1 Tax=Shinella sp. JR1-6 TaxID=2527671 RepID=UPI00102D4831|nr:hypothetical protein [Shinella sp. JR1-6]TAA61878.1 hypothetical protein EXZ48_12200 [Shinella sp. JR1-6]
MAKEAQKVVSIREEIALSLDDRIADAFDNVMSAAALTALLQEVQETSAAAKAESKAASALALDPRLRPADVADARQRMQDADFRSTRLDRAAEELADVLTDAKRREAAQAAEVEYQAAKAERDQLVKELSEDYPALAARLISLLERVAANNERLVRANPGRQGDMWLRSAEAVAREALPNWEVNPTSDFPSLIQGVRLPHFKRAGIHGYAWPRYSGY